METEEAIRVFGFDPRHMGLRHREWWVEEDGNWGRVSIGDLVVCARDGGGNEIDPDPMRQPNYKTTLEDDGDYTYRYYIFSPLV